MVPGTVSFKIGTTNYIDDGAGKIYSYADGAEVTVMTNYVAEAVDPNNGNLEGVAGRFVKTITGASEAGTITYGSVGTKGVRTVANGTPLIARQATDGTGGMERIYDASAAVITLTVGVTGSTAIKYNYKIVVASFSNFNYNFKF